MALANKSPRGLLISMCTILVVPCLALVGATFEFGRVVEASETNITQNTQTSAINTGRIVKIEAVAPIAKQNKQEIIHVKEIVARVETRVGKIEDKLDRLIEMELKKAK